MCTKKTFFLFNFLNMHILVNFKTLPTPAGYPLELHFQIPCVFPLRLQVFPVPIYVICDYYIHKTNLADLSSFKENLKIFAANIWKYFTFRLREFRTWAKPNSLCFGKISKFPVFSLTEFFLPFSLFSLCSGYPDQASKKLQTLPAYYEVTPYKLFYNIKTIMVWWYTYNSYCCKYKSQSSSLSSSKIHSVIKRWKCLYCFSFLKWISSKNVKYQMYNNSSLNDLVINLPCHRNHHICNENSHTLLWQGKDPQTRKGRLDFHESGRENWHFINGGVRIFRMVELWVVHLHCNKYTEQTGLAIFECAATIAIGSWYYASALESIRGTYCFRYRSENIALIYKQ